MRSNYLKETLKTAVLAVTILLLGVGVSVAQQQVNLTAAPATLTTPDGAILPMWGYSCGAVAAGSTATCAKSNPAATGWSPVVITVPTGQGLQINLTNNLVFGANQIPTSLVIVGQVGGGLGDKTQRTTTASPSHDNQATTWPIANAGPIFTPPAQGVRVQSFSTEVAAGATTSLTWAAPRAGTYLIESGTHPSIQGPMGLYGVLVVTNAPAGATAGTAYPGVTYAADIPMLLSEIDPAQNNAVNTAVNTAGFSESATIGPYLAGPIVSISVTNGGSGYTSVPTVNFAAGAATATAVIDTDSTSPTFGQVTGVNIVNPGSYTSSPSITFSGGGGSGAAAISALQLNTNGISHCSGGAAACYPPAVNYTPLYYLINGAAFDKTHAGTSLFAAAPATGVAGNVLVRMVNAGLHMHVPSIVGSQTGATAAGGFSLIAEDGNPLPGVLRVQSEVFMAPGKTYDVMINTPVAGATALPIYDRELSLSGNATARDAGMLAYISVNGAGLPTAPSFTGAVAVADTYNSLVAGQTFTVSDPSKGVIANDTNVFGVKVTVAATNGTVTLSENGTFTYVPTASATSDSFTYCGNGTLTGPACALVTLGPATIESAGGITMGNITYHSTVATYLSIKAPGVLSVDSDAAGHPLTVNAASVSALTGPGTGTLSVDPQGGFNASVTVPGTYTFTYKAQNSQGTASSTTGTVTVIFPTASNLAVSVLDGVTRSVIGDYRWVIEEDRTFYIDPKCTTNPQPAGCPVVSGGIVPTFGTNFHTSYMPVVATGCVGTLACESGQTVLGTAAVCDVGNGICRTTATQQTEVNPSQVALDPTKRYYISILPGDAGNPFAAGYASLPNCVADGSNHSVPSANCGHGMGGAPITFGQTAVTVLVEPTPLQTAKLSVFVFEDDFPLNGENDAGGGVDALSPNEPGLGGFNITLFDDAGGSGDATGQMTYDMFNMPLSNALSGTIDPLSGQDACPVSLGARQTPGGASPTGITGTIVTCPEFESDGTTHSPLRGQAVVANMMPGRYGVVATPAADRIARGEEWLQTNTLDGQKAHDSFLRVAEPSYFQEFGPAGYHVSIGFANPKIINGRLAGVCNGTDPNITGTGCNNTVTALVTAERMSRTPDERLFSSGDNSAFAFTQCYASIGDPDGEDFAFAKCDGTGRFTFTGIPNGSWRVTVFDQWNDMLVDGLSTPVGPLSGGTTDMGQIAMNQWQANIYTQTFFDLNGDGVRQDTEPGLALVPTNIRFRDGSYSNFNNTDLNGNAGFNEVFPLFSWYVIETDVTRYKSTGTHVVYDAGGPSDGSPCGGTTGVVCGNSNVAHFMANTAEQISLPANLRVPGSVYCATADCTGLSIASGPVVGGSSGPGGSTGRIDAPWAATTYGWQGFSGQNSFLEFGKKPFAVNENGGIHGEVIYASTRPFDDPALLIHTSWTPDVPHVTINLYQEGTGPDGSQTLKLVDTTQTTSWDDWAQGFRSDGVPNMNCPGQGRDTGTTADLFFFSLFNQPNYLDVYYNGAAAHALPGNSQFKCYDGMHNWNQLQPAPYDGMYQFPSVTGINPTTGRPSGTNCTICSPDTTPTTDPNYDPYHAGLPMLPQGKYVVEMVTPPGYELVKEEDKNILIGDNYIAPVTQQFGGLGSIFILPDQAQVGAAYNGNNAQNSTNALGRTSFPSSEGDTGSVEVFWPCVGAARVVPDFISLYPQSGEVAPFAGATRNLCDRKEVTLNDQMSVLAKFWVFTSAHVAAHYTGVITDDYTSEFDPFSPQFGEKFSPPDLPISIKDFNGNEISRTYSDHWGTYNGLNYSTWEVNPPNPTGYAPTMMITCMNDPGPIPDPNNAGQMITDPLYNPQYSQFCYEIPFMPGQTQYMDTPVVPTSAFAGAGYNNPDCAYPDATPAVSEVDGDGIGPWVSAATGHTLTIKALGDQLVPNNAYAGPQQTATPYNQKKITRHYGFGATKGSVSIGGVAVTAANITTWSDTLIVVNVPSGVPNCTIQQQAQYGGSTAQCGQLVVTAANGKQSVDAVTVTIGGKAPTHVSATSSIQTAIDTAKPGDLLIIDPTCTTTAGPVACATTGANAGAAHSTAAHNEMLLMWKPVRLQGVGAASSVINANAHPAGKLDPWRRQVDCLFGLALNATAIATGNPYDSTGQFTCAPSMQFQVDRLPLEATVGWDATLNGNLAEQLQEPTLMGAYEGAAITVLAKGVRFPRGSQPFAADTFPTGTTLLTANSCTTSRSNQTNPFPSNFWCNPSSIDGLGITDSSQGGGGIFVHAWAHNLQIGNNRVNSNTGTVSGGISIGQGEFPPLYQQNGATPNADPGSCYPALRNLFSSNFVTTNTELPYCFNLNVNVHNNAITSNNSLGDELFSGTPSGAGGIAFCTGADNYKFQNNWVCGNLSTGDGGGVVHMGFSYNGDIEHNAILFNQSVNPTIASNGGGLLIMGSPDTDPVCGGGPDADCAPGTSDGTGPNLVINANLIQGNAAESGSGGGIRFQGVNGTEVTFFPDGRAVTTGPSFLRHPSRWYSVSVTNNIIANNVAGWDGAGVSLQDALEVNFINNTIVSNDTTASSGVLFNTLGAPIASSGGPCPGNTNPSNTTPCVTTSTPQPSGLVAIQNSATLKTDLGALTITCPTGHPNCKSMSYPLLANNVFWENRAFNISVGSLGGGTINQQHVVTLLPTLNQPQADAVTSNGNGLIVTGGTGACVTSGASYWDIGVRLDTAPNNHGSGFTLAPTYSVLTDAGDYPGANNTNSNPTVLSQYCNGSRIPPELGSAGYQVPPGISDATVPNPIFNLTPAATVDEGNNWINMSWGPLALTHPLNGTVLGNYGIAAGSPAISYIPNTATTNYNEAPSLDFFNNPRKTNNAVDAGAVEFLLAPNTPSVSITGGPLAFGNVTNGTTSAAQTLTLHNTGTGAFNGITLVFSPTPAFARSGGTCGASLAAGATCTINVVFSPTASGLVNGTLTVTGSNAAVAGSPVSLSGTGVKITRTPTSLNFLVLLGSGFTATQNVTVGNVGPGPIVGPITTSITNVTSGVTFQVQSTTCPTSAATSLAQGTTCLIRVRFQSPTPFTFGTATLNITDSEPATVTVGLTGTRLF
jgi:hypothetical protein